MRCTIQHMFFCRNYSKSDVEIIYGQITWYYSAHKAPLCEDNISNDGRVMSEFK